MGQWHTASNKNSLTGIVSRDKCFFLRFIIINRLLSVRAAVVFSIFGFLVDEKIKLKVFLLAPLKLLTNFENPPVTRFKDPKAAIFDNENAYRKSPAHLVLNCLNMSWRGTPGWRRPPRVSALVCSISLFSQLNSSLPGIELLDHELARHSWLEKASLSVCLSACAVVLFPPN